MHLHFTHHHLHIFDNRQVDALYITAALFNVGLSLITLFVPIYLWEIGFSLPRILFFYFFISGSFLVLSLFLLPLQRRMSDKVMVLTAIPFVVLYFWGLRELPSVTWLFYVIPACNALYRLFYNVGIHIDFAASMDSDKIGREVAGSRIVIYGMRFLSPLAGGFLIAAFGFGNAFIIAAGVLLLALVPLSFLPSRRMVQSITRREIWRSLVHPSLRGYTFSGVAFGMETMVQRIVWPLFIFFTIGSVAAFGGVMAAGILGLAVVSYIAGSMADQGRRRGVIRWSSALFAVVWLVRTVVFRAPAVVTAHIAGDASYGLLSTAWSSQFYRLARAVENAGAFIMSREWLYHIARVIFLPMLAGLAMVLPQGTFLTISFVTAAVLSLGYMWANRTHTSTVERLVGTGISNAANRLPE